MKTAEKTIKYFYRGGVERGMNYEWKNGYSADGENGGVLYPWMTAAECRADAKLQGKKAIIEDCYNPEVSA
jgi:hypothetical protein